jgi:hypothetical protein
MNRSHRIASQHKRRMMALASNPVALAFQRAGAKTRAQRAQEEFADQLLTVRISMLSAEDGEDATELLAKLAVVIGTPCEAGARQYGHTEPWVRQLHGALRTIQAMCLQGYRWQAHYALALDRAIEVAAEPRELDDPGFTDSWIEASGLAGRILNHDVDAEAIAA